MCFHTGSGESCHSFPIAGRAFAALVGTAAIRGDKGASILGPDNPVIASHLPDLLSPPLTDYGTLPNLKFSFSETHMRLEEGG